VPRGKRLHCCLGLPPPTATAAAAMQKWWQQWGRPTFGWLLCFFTKQQPPKAEIPSLSPFFDGCNSAPKTREQRVSRVHLMHHVIVRTIAVHGAKSWGHGRIFHGNNLLDGRAAAAHLVVYLVLSQHSQHTTLLCVVSILLAFPLLIVEYSSKLGKLSPQQKLGNNGPP
jgi:hypothetical protein